MKPTLNRISLTITLLGILILLTLSTFPPKKIPISEIYKKPLYHKVNIQGKITHEKTFNKHNFELIILKDNSNSTIDIIIDKPLNLTLNQEVRIIGEIIPYKKTIQVKADKVIIK